MDQFAPPFALPAHLQPDLARVLAYWEGLKRGQAEMPFWDDAKLTDLPDLADRLALIDVFEAPERFRFGVVGDQVAATQSSPVAGRFLDEISLDAPLDYLRAQCAASTEAGAPTYFKTSVPLAQRPRACGRLILPLWGEGQLRMLLLAMD